MDILLFSKVILILALILFSIAALRAGAYKSTAMGLLSSSAIVVTFAMALLIVGDIFSITYTGDIALTLILFGFVGTIAFSIIMEGDEWLFSNIYNLY